MGAREEMRAVARLRGATPPGTLHDVLVEVEGVYTNHMRGKSPGSGFIDAAGGQCYCTSYYQGDGTIDYYTIRYKPNDTPNVVHELTHAAIHEAYDRDFISYAAGPGGDGGVPARVISGGGTCSNQELRQNRMQDMDRTLWLSGVLMALNSQLPNAGLEAELSTWIGSQLMYGAPKPHLEYDTVVNQILVRLAIEGIMPQAPGIGGRDGADNQFASYVEAVAQEAYDRRAQGVSVDVRTNSPVPNAAPPVRAAPAPAPARRRRRICFLTSACVEVAGLPDDCRELETLRAFRDRHLARQAQGRQLLEEYDELAPRILDALETRIDREVVLRSILGVIRDCVVRIEAGEFDEAVDQYSHMVRSLRRFVLHEGPEEAEHDENPRESLHHHHVQLHAPVVPGPEPGLRTSELHLLLPHRQPLAPDHGPRETEVRGGEEHPGGLDRPHHDVFQGAQRKGGLEPPGTVHLAELISSGGGGLSGARGQGQRP